MSSGSLMAQCDAVCFFLFTYCISGPIINITSIHLLVLKVTKKTDLSDFYFNLGKNVAFGANDVVEPRKTEKLAELRNSDRHEEGVSAERLDKHRSSNDSNSLMESSTVGEEHRRETSLQNSSSKSPDTKPVSNTTAQENSSIEPPPVEQPKSDHHKRSEDAVAAAKERFLARKRAKEQ